LDVPEAKILTFFGFSSGFLGSVIFKKPFLVVSFDLIHIYVIGKGKRAAERPVRAFNAVIILFLRFFFKFFFALEDQLVAFDLDLDIFVVQARNLSRNGQSLLGFMNIH
jgi:hypothetical protein